jgi:hypothetical protein
MNWNVPDIIIVTGVVAYVLVIALYITAKRREVGDEFRHAVRAALAGILPAPGAAPGPAEMTCLAAALPAIEAAVARFRPFISFTERRAFDEAWRRFQLSTAMAGALSTGSPPPATVEGGEHPHLPIYQGVEALLRFAR